jgi:hypothetical protein
MIPAMLALASGCALLRPAPPTREELAKQGLAIAIAERLVDEVWRAEGDAGFLLVRPPADTGIQRWDIRVRNVFLGRYPLMLRVADTTRALRIRITDVRFDTDTAVVSLAHVTCGPGGPVSITHSNYVFAAAGTSWRFTARRPVSSANGLCPAAP